MKPKLVDQYWDQYGKKYLSREIFSCYPETKIIPQYILREFTQSQIVLDLGFGTGLWFWASFLPNLLRVDGIDLHPEALEAADKVFRLDGVPEGYALVHRKLRRKFTRDDLDELAGKRGAFFFFDYTKRWPRKIKKNHYDLITEHGGGFGELKTKDEVSASIRHCADALKPGGCLFFVNFQMKSSSASKSFRLSEEVLSQSIQRAGMERIDFKTTTLRKGDRIKSSIEKIFYGYAQKPAGDPGTP